MSSCCHHQASTIYAAYGKTPTAACADDSTTTSSKSNSRTAAVANSGSPAHFSLKPRTWVEQAADITDGLLDADKYKSLAVYAEVRFAEALDKAAQACPNSIAGAAPEDCEDGQPLPNPLTTAVCCQVGRGTFCPCLPQHQVRNAGLSALSSFSMSQCVDKCA